MYHRRDDGRNPLEKLAAVTHRSRATNTIDVTFTAQNMQITHMHEHSYAEWTQKCHLISPSVLPLLPMTVWYDTHAHKLPSFISGTQLCPTFNENTSHTHTHTYLYYFVHQSEIFGRRQWSTTQFLLSDCYIYHRSSSTYDICTLYHKPFACCSLMPIFFIYSFIS